MSPLAALVHPPVLVDQNDERWNWLRGQGSWPYYMTFSYMEFSDMWKIVDMCHGPTANSDGPSDGVHCTCGGPAVYTGFNTLVIAVCTRCKKEKP